MRHALVLSCLIVAGCGSRAAVDAVEDTGGEAAPAVTAPTTSASSGTVAPPDPSLTSDAAPSEVDGGSDSGITGDEVPTSPPACVIDEPSASWRIWLDDGGRVLVDAYDYRFTRVRTTTHRYNPTGRLARLTVTHHAPDDECFDYSGNFMTQHPCVGGVDSSTFELDAHDRVIGRLPGSSWTRDADGRVTSYVTSGAGTTPSTTTLSFDALGRLETVDVIETKGPTTADRCHVRLAWTDDATGFWVSFAPGSNVSDPSRSCHYTFDALDRLVTASCGTTSSRIGNTWSYRTDGSFTVVGEGIFDTRHFSFGCPRPPLKGELARWLLVHRYDTDPRPRPIDGPVTPTELPLDCVLVAE